MKDDKNTETPGPPPVPRARKVKEPKAAAPTSAKSSADDGQKPKDAPETSVNPDADIDQDIYDEEDIAEASDEFLDKEEKAELLPNKSVGKSGGGKIRRFFKAWWGNKKARQATILIIVLAIVGVLVYPRTRYFLLNSAGVRSSASVTVVDNATRQPLKNVTVRLNNASGVTNQDGYVRLERVRLGSTNLMVERRAFATLEKKITVGWGSNPLGEVLLEPKGLQYSFIVKDFLSGQPIEKAEATSGDASAFSDKEGKLVLTLDNPPEEAVEIAIKADGYREEKLMEMGESVVDQPVDMVPARQQPFISKRSGKYDLYKIYADGSGESLVLSGTGFERDDIVLAPQSSGDNVALVSTRDGARSPNGNLLSTLNIINLNDNKVNKLDTADRIQPVDWIGNTLVYILVNDQPTDNSKKQRIVSYNIDTGQKLDISTANFFNSVAVIGDKIYYAPAVDITEEGDQDKTANLGLYVSNPSGSDIKRMIDQEVWNMVRTGYDTVALTTGRDWYEFKTSDNKVQRIGGAPADQKPRVYVNNSANNQSLWVDQRDGKGVLLSFDIAGNSDKVLTGQSGLGYPVRWLNNSTAVYRIKVDREIADYVVSLNGGEPRKIVDVTNTSGIDKWYYY